jgi:two-component system sensor histidine kinase KdpD
MDPRLRRLIFAGRGYPFAAVVVVVAAALLLPLRPLLPPPAIMLVFVPVIITLARLFGVQVSAAASVLAFFALDFLFLPPYYRLVVGSLPEWLGLCVFLIVALAAGQQTGQLRRREQAAVRRQAELELLNALSARIASAKSEEEIADFVVRQAEEVLGARRAALYVPGTGTAAARCLASAGLPAPSSGEEALVLWSIRHGQAIGLSPSAEGLFTTVPADAAVPGVTADGVYIPLQTADAVEGVLYAMLPEDGRSEAADPSLLAAVTNLVAASFQRQRLEEEASRAEALREADRLRTTLVSSVSHELKTPLAAATARVTGLLDEPVADAGRVHEELAEVAEDLDRLNVSIGDLLDLSRLESDAWRPHREMYEVGEVLGTVLARLPAAQRPRVRFGLGAEAPSVCCDFAQLARALVNVVENALAYSPAGTPVVVAAREEAGEVLVAVEDAGPGVADADKLRVFEKFYRGAASAQAPGGTGLGLAIAREIVRTHGGRMWVEDVRPTGARFVIALPAGPCGEERG